MNDVIAVNGLLVIAAIVALGLVALYLARLVKRDGLGSNPPPRSHVAELGAWADRQLQR